MKRANQFLLLLLFIFFSLNLFFPERAWGEEKQKLPEKYKKWLNEEVVYIISQSEREVFLSLKTDEQREEFIKNFWKRRDPTPETPFNEYKEEHYRRIEYANRHFFEGIEGWRTDRGRVYIMFGPPDFFESNPGGGRGFLFNPSGPTAEFPSEVWVYRYIPGLKLRTGRIELTFVNYYHSGKYQLTTSPALANALRNTSIESRNVGYEDPKVQVPGSTEKDLPVNPLEQLQILTEVTKSRGEVFEELERSARLRKLKGIVEAKESLSTLPFYMNLIYLMGENELTSVPISVEISGKDVAFIKNEERYNGSVNFYIEIKQGNKTVYQSSDRLVMNLREETYQRRFTDYYQYRHKVSLNPGKYIFYMVVWDEVDNKVGYVEQPIEVPQILRGQFSISDILLARDINFVEEEQKQPVIESKEIQALQTISQSGLKVPETIEVEKKEDPFSFANLQINPNPLSEYSRNDELIFFYQIYSPTFSVEQKKAKLLIVHQIEREGQIIATIDKPQEVHILESQKTAIINSGARYELASLSPGRYTLVVRVKDIFLDKTIEKKADFRIK